MIDADGLNSRSKRLIKNQRPISKRLLFAIPSANYLLSISLYCGRKEDIGIQRVNG